MQKKIYLLILFVLIIATPINATTLKKKSGEIITGDIINFENSVVTIKTTQGVVKIQLTDLSTDSQYKIKKQYLNHDNPIEHLSLAEFCIEKELYSDAISEIILAGEISDKLIENAIEMLKRTRLLHADKLRQDARQLKEGRKYVEALSLYLQYYKEYSDSDDISTIKKEITIIQGILGMQKTYPPTLPLPSLLLKKSDKNIPPVKPDDKKDNELSSSQIKKLNKYKENFEKAKKLIDQAVLYKKAARLKDMQSEFNDKINLYLKAEKSFMDAKQILEQLIQRKEDWFADLIEDAKLVINDEAIEGLTEVARDMMHLYIEKTPSRPDYQNSLKWLNKVLAYAPYDQKARDLRTSITESILKEARK